MARVRRPGPDDVVHPAWALRFDPVASGRSEWCARFVEYWREQGASGRVVLPVADRPGVGRGHLFWLLARMAEARAIDKARSTP